MDICRFSPSLGRMLGVTDPTPAQDGVTQAYANQRKVHPPNHTASIQGWVPYPTCQFRVNPRILARVTGKEVLFSTRTVSRKE